jgi:Flp pilus assembly protein TadG
MPYRAPISSLHFLKDTRATSAIEFAIVFPLFLILLFGIIIFGSYLATVHGVQQLAAEAARSSVAGLSDTERASIAQSYVTQNVQYYPLILPNRVSVSASAAAGNPNVFVVTVSYDDSTSFIYFLPQFVPAPPPNIVETAAIPRGGF